MADLVSQVIPDPSDLPQESSLPAPKAAQIPVTDTTAFLLNPDGQIVEGPRALLPQALQSGYKLATQENIQDFQNQKLYGEGIGNELKAAALGAGEGATFGLSTLALTKSGLVNPETISQIEERNPISHGAGMVGGILGSSLLPGGGLVGGASALGNAVTKGALNIGTAGIEALQATGLAGKALDFTAQVGSKAIGSALEGSLYSGLGNSITEAALGDPDLNAEKILSNFGYGAVIGGTLGSVIKAGELTLPKAYNAAKNAVGSLYDLAVGKAGEEPGALSQAYAKASSSVTGIPSEDILKGLKDRAVQASTQEDLTKLGSTLTNNLSELKDQVSNTVKKTISDIRPQEVENLLSDVPLQKVAPAADQVSKLIDDSIAKMQAAPELYPERFASKLQLIKDGFDKSIYGEDVDTASDLFKSINTVKHEIDTKIPWAKEALSGESADAINELKGLRTSVKNVLQDQDLWGSAAARQASFNSAYSDYLDSEKAFNKLFVSKYTNGVNPNTINSFLKNMEAPQNFNRSAVLKNYIENSQSLLNEVKNTYENVPNQTLKLDQINDLLQKHVDTITQAGLNNASQAAFQSLNTGRAGSLTNLGELAALVHMPALIPVIEAGKAIANPGTTISRLMAMEKVVNTVTSAIEKGSKGLFNVAESGLDATKGLIAESYTHQKLLQKHQAFADDLNKNLANPQNFIDTVTNATHPMFQAAPNTANSLNNTAYRAASFLQSKLPPQIKGGVLNETEEPSDAEISHFNRYKAIVDKPLSIFNQIKDNTITPESVEALQAVYPSLLNDIRANISNHLAGLKNPNEIPYDLKLNLSTLLGEPLDRSLSTQNLISNQQLISATNLSKQVQQTPKRSNSKNLGKLSLSERSQTSFQQAATRQS